MNWKSIRGGWCLGRPEFKAELLKRMEGKLGEHHSGELRHKSEPVRAEWIINEEFKHRRWKEQDLVDRAKSDPEKLAMAARLRRETTLTIPLIAKRPIMGRWKSFSAKLHHWNKTSE